MKVEFWSSPSFLLACLNILNCYSSSPLNDFVLLHPHCFISCITACPLITIANGKTFESWFCSESSSKRSELVDQPIWQVSPQLWGYCNKFNTHTLKLQVHIAQSTPITESNLRTVVAFAPDLQHLNKRGYSHLTKTFPQSSSQDTNWLLPHCSVRGHIWKIKAGRRITEVYFVHVSNFESAFEHLQCPQQRRCWRLHPLLFFSQPPWNSD